MTQGEALCILLKSESRVVYAFDIMDILAKYTHPMSLKTLFELTDTQGDILI